MNLLILPICVSILSVLPVFSFAKESNFKKELAQELREKESLTPSDSDLESDWGNVMSSKGILSASTTINGKHYRVPAIPLSKSGILIVPNIIISKDQKVVLNAGENSEELYPIVSSENNYTVLKSSIAKDVKIKVSRKIKKGQEIIYLPLLCEYQCEATFGLILNSGSPNVFPNIHYEYNRKEHFMGAIFNKSGELIGFNLLTLNLSETYADFNRELYFLLTVNELEKYLVSELGYSPFEGQGLN